MQGVLGVKPYVPRSNKRARRFSSSWKWKFQQDNLDNIDADMNTYGLRAYDAATAFALAIENAGTTNFGLQKANVSRNPSTDLATLGVSLYGPNLHIALSNTSFKGLAGYWIGSCNHRLSR
jgi:ionotropic glutamate receptor